MINHARTLLANLKAADVEGFGEEIIDPQFTPLDLGPELSSFRRALFGGDPDRPYICGRAKQIMTVLHAGPFAGDIYRMDPRITYVSKRSVPYLKLSQRVRITRLAGSSDPFLVGDPVADPASGRCHHVWTASIDSDSVVTLYRSTSPLQIVSVTASFSGGLSDLIDLVGSDLSLRVPDEPGASWRIEVVGKIDSVKNAYDNIRGLSSEVWKSIWGTVDLEPFRSYRNAWERGADFSSRLSGAVMGYIRRLDLLWRATRAFR